MKPKEKALLNNSLTQRQYSKDEVLKLLIDYGKKREDQSREKTLNEILSHLSDLKEKIGSDFYFRINPNIIDPDKKNTFRGYLYEKLKDNLYFDGEVRKQDFERVFSGVEAKKGEPIKKIKWKSARQGMYLLYCLFENNIIDDNNYSIKAEKFFGIDSNSATSAWNAVKDPPNPNVPTGRLAIETYVKDALRIVAPERVT